MDSHDINGAQTIVRYLCRGGISWYRNSKTGVWKETFDVINDGFTIHQGSDAVDGIFLKQDQGKIDGPFILLAPPSKDGNIVCLLGVYWKLTEAARQMSLYLHMFGSSQTEKEPPWYRGYRLELSHGSGSHDYTHVQPCNANCRVSRTRGRSMDGTVPESFPAFPLLGSTLTTLCAALAVALHGKSVLAAVVPRLRGQRIKKDVQKLYN